MHSIFMSISFGCFSNYLMIRFVMSLNYLHAFDLNCTLTQFLSHLIQRNIAHLFDQHLYLDCVTPIIHLVKTITPEHKMYDDACLSILTVRTRTTQCLLVKNNFIASMHQQQCIITITLTLFIHRMFIPCVIVYSTYRIF